MRRGSTRSSIRSRWSGMVSPETEGESGGYALIAVPATAIAGRNYAGDEEAREALSMGCRLCRGHGDSMSDNLLDHDQRPFSVCQQAFRLLGRDMGGGRYCVRLQGSPCPKPVCGDRALDSNVR